MSLAPGNDGADRLVCELSASVAFRARPGQPVGEAMRAALEPRPEWIEQAAAEIVWELQDNWGAARAQRLAWAYRLPLEAGIDGYVKMFDRVVAALEAFAARGGRVIL